MARVVLSSPSLTHGMLSPFDLNMTMCSNMVMFEVMSCVHPLSGIAMSGEDSWRIVERVCLVLVKRWVLLPGVPPGSVGESNRTVLRARTGMLAGVIVAVSPGTTVGGAGTTVGSTGVGTTLGTIKEGK